jgi:regulator of sigma E protease
MEELTMIVSLLAFALVFTIVVLVHELGHFLAARKSGVKVYEFSIGFPFSPRCLTLFRHKETVFTVRLLPLGGFVGFSRDNGEEDIELFGVSYWKRALILSAGSLFNVFFAFAVFTVVFAVGKDSDPLSALMLSAKTVWEILSGTLLFIVKALSGHGAVEGVSGPVGIAVMAGEAAGKGVLSLCTFTGMLSLSIGIMNLLPLPTLDGGHLAMLLIEAVRRRPLNPRVYQAATAVGLLLFLILTVLVTYKDIARLIA